MQNASRRWLLVLPVLAAVVAVAAVVLSLLGDDPADRTRSGSPDASRTAPDVPAAAGVETAPAHISAPAPASADRTQLSALRDLELALEAALAERRAAEDALRSAEAAMLEVEDRLDLRVEQGESPDSLEAEADAMLERVFDDVQAALRRLDQADASVEMLEEEVALARRAPVDD